MRAGNGDRAGRAARLLLLLLLLLRVKNGARVSADWTDRQTVSVERCDEAGREAGMQGRGRSQAIRQRTDDATPRRHADYYLLRRRRAR